MQARLILITEPDGVVSVISPGLPGFSLKVGYDVTIGHVIEAATIYEDTIPPPEPTPWEALGISKSAYYQRKTRGKL